MPAAAKERTSSLSLAAGVSRGQKPHQGLERSLSGTHQAVSVLNLQNALGMTLRVRRNGSGVICYGEEITGTANDTFKFAQLYRDSDSGLDYANQRYYANSLGRFLTTDPAGIKAVDSSVPATWNAYHYSGNDPINFSDPSGLLQAASNGYCDPSQASCDPSMCSFYLGSEFMSMPPPGCFGGGGGIGVGGGSGPPEPPALDCQFNGALFGQAGAGTTTRSRGPGLPPLQIPGWFQPAAFMFFVTGGDAAQGYSWINTQNVSATLSVTATEGATPVVTQGTGTEHLFTAASPSGLSATVTDNPGLIQPVVGNNYQVIGQWNFTLNVTVRNGAQSVKCPTVTWHELMIIKKDSSGTPQLLFSGPSVSP